MIHADHLVPVLEGLSVLPNAPAIEAGHVKLYLGLLNSRSVDPPPYPDELHEAAMDVLASERFFPAPVVLLEAIQAVRERTEARATKLLEERRSARLAYLREQAAEWAKGVTAGKGDARERVDAVLAARSEFETRHGCELNAWPTKDGEASLHVLPNEPDQDEKVRLLERAAAGGGAA